MDNNQNNSDSDIEIIVGCNSVLDFEKYRSASQKYKLLSELKSYHRSKEVYLILEQDIRKKEVENFKEYKHSLQRFNTLSEIKSLSKYEKQYVIYVDDSPVNICYDEDEARRLITYYADKIKFQFCFQLDYICSTVQNKDMIEIYGSYRNYLIKYDKLLFRAHFVEVKEYYPHHPITEEYMA